MMDWIWELSPRQQARMAGMFSLAYFFFAMIGILAMGRNGVVHEAARFLSNLLYAVVVLLFYALFKPSDSALSLIAAIFGFLGCAVAILKIVLGNPFPFPAIVFSGMHLCLIGWLAFESRLLPRVLGVLMMLGGVSWLTLVLPPLGNALDPYNSACGVLVRIVLTVWLLAADVDVPDEVDEFAG